MHLPDIGGKVEAGDVLVIEAVIWRIMCGVVLKRNLIFGFSLITTKTNKQTNKAIEQLSAQPNRAPTIQNPEPHRQKSY
jgi:hypothetical protein